MSARNHPRRWDSVHLDERNRLPQASGVYAVIKQRKIYYIGVSTNLNRRWSGKSHHRFPQADKLGRPKLHYLLLPKQDARTLEKLLIVRYDPPWNYSKVPELNKTHWLRRVLMMIAWVWVLLISSRSLVLGFVAAVIAILLFR